MGSGTWSSVSYNTTRAAYAASGIDDMHYDADYRAGKTTTVSPVLDPTVKAGTASPFAGTVMREVAISTEHPNPTPVVIALDVTGSNYRGAKVVHEKLPQLLGALQRIGGIEDPQIMIMAIGDATCDAIPLQVGQFESDNKIDEMIENMILEGGGGGQQTESYELGAYYLAYHTHLETVEQQGRKGYVFFIADEKNYPQLDNEFSGGGYWGTSRSHTLESLVGDKLEKPIPTEDIYAKLHEQYNVYHLHPASSSYSATMTQPHWRALLENPEHSVVLADDSAVCEFVAGLLAMAEGGLELDEVADALTDSGFAPGAVAAAGAALAKVGAGSGGGGTVATTDGSLGLDSTGGTDRL